MRQPPFTSQAGVRTWAWARIHHIDTVLSAVNRIGTTQIIRIALQVVSSESFKKAAESHLPDLWEHSLYTAVAAQVLASRTRVDLDLAFTAGLLHDIGKFALWYEFRTDYLQLLADSRLTMRPLFKLEQERVRIDHAAVGGRLLSEWNFSEPIVNAVAFHHHPLLNLGRLPIKLSLKLPDSRLVTGDCIAFRRSSIANPPLCITVTAHEQ